MILELAWRFGLSIVSSCEGRGAACGSQRWVRVGGLEKKDFDLRFFIGLLSALFVAILRRIVRAEHLLATGKS